MKVISEITMIDAGNLALASGRPAYIVINDSGALIAESSMAREKRALELQAQRPAVAMITGHKTFSIIDSSYTWAVDPQKVQEIHLNRRIQPWPRRHEKPGY